MHATGVEILATSLFALAILHTFSIKVFQHLALRHPQGSIAKNIFHLLGEVEIVFGFWAALLCVIMAFLKGAYETVAFIEHLPFTEPAFVFVIMAMAATKPVLDVANGLILRVARPLPWASEISFLLVALTLGPLLGSLITEPAAMTVTALLLRERLFSQRISEKLKYATLGVLFVNVSIGGVLTPYAAPPVLMVARLWQWDLAFMLSHFGWKAVLAILLNTSLLTLLFSQELKTLAAPGQEVRARLSPVWLRLLHLIFLLLVVLFAHHAVVFLGIFLFFLGFATVTREYQSALQLRESLLVGFFLGGLVVMGSQQSWWLDPLLHRLDALSLFLGATVLTAFNDNAAITYLGSRVSGVSEGFKYALVAGSIAGGGLTVIANAPNPAGFSILQERFGPEGINPLKLAWAALVPTLIGMACLWFLPSL